MTELGAWIAQHGMGLLEAMGIIGGLAFTAVSFRADTRSRRLSNLIELTKQHRDIWEEALGKPGFVRVKDPKADLYTKPVTSDEARLVNFLILHLHCWYRAVLEGEVLKMNGLSRDMQSFFSMPIPNQVWTDSRQYYDPDFVAFVELALQTK